MFIASNDVLIIISK